MKKIFLFLGIVVTLFTSMCNKTETQFKSVNRIISTIADTVVDIQERPVLEAIFNTFKYLDTGYLRPVMPDTVRILIDGLNETVVSRMNKNKVLNFLGAVIESIPMYKYEIYMKDNSYNSEEMIYWVIYYTQVDMFAVKRFNMYYYTKGETILRIHFQ